MKQFFLALMTLFLAQAAFAQNYNAKVEGRVNDSDGKTILSVYGPEEHQIFKIDGSGKFSASLKIDAEYVLLFYHPEKAPVSYSISTYQAARSPISISVNHPGPKPNDENLLAVAPSKRYYFKSSSIQSSGFDLDQVKDKGGYAMQMGKGRGALLAFYKTGKTPSPYRPKILGGTDESLKKSEHVVGEEIYRLSKRKSYLESQLKTIKSKPLNGLGPDANETQIISFCASGLKVLEAELKLKKIEFDLASKQYDRGRIKSFRSEQKGGSPNNKGMKSLQRKKDQAKLAYDIALLNAKSKKSDCTTQRLQFELDALYDGNTSPAEELAIMEKKIQLSNIRLKNRYDNAIRQYHHYNDLATSVTGRNRLVELSHAQKNVWDQAEAKMLTTTNNLKLAKAKNEMNPSATQQAAIKSLTAKKNKEEKYAYIAEMGYLEHLWHLRDKVDIYDDPDNIYATQNDLLAVAPLRSLKEEEEEIVPEVATSQEAEDAKLLEAIETRDFEDERGKVHEMKYKDLVYEMVIRENGSKKHYKNGKPISSLTFNFETKRLFGEISVNIKEEERKGKLWELFKKKFSR